jgi:hypothetical protein
VEVHGSLCSLLSYHLDPLQIPANVIPRLKSHDDAHNLGDQKVLKPNMAHVNLRGQTGAREKAEYDLAFINCVSTMRPHSAHSSCIASATFWMEAPVYERRLDPGQQRFRRHGSYSLNPKTMWNETSERGCCSSSSRYTKSRLYSPLGH